MLRLNIAKMIQSRRKSVKICFIISVLVTGFFVLAACSSVGFAQGDSEEERIVYVDGQLTQSGEAVATCGEDWGYSLWLRKCIKPIFPWQHRTAFSTVGMAFISSLDFSVIEIREGVYEENEIGIDPDGVVLLVSDLTIRNYKDESVTISNDNATRVTFMLHHKAENLHFQGLILQGVRSERVSGWEPVPDHPNLWRVLYQRGLVQKLYNEEIYGWPVVCILGPGDTNIEGCLADIYGRERFYQDYLRDETGQVIGMNGYLYVYSDGDPNEEEIIVGGNYAMGSSGGTGGLIELDTMTFTGFSHSSVKGNYGWWIHDSYFTDLGLDGYDHHVYTQTVATEDNPVIIERNYFGEAMGCAIKLAPEPPINPLPEYYIIRHNVFKGNVSCGLFIGSRYSEVYNNTFYNSGIGIWFYNPRSDDFGVPESHDNRIFNNVLDGNAIGDLQVYYFDGDLSPGYNQVWHNFLGSENPCVNCFCEYQHYGAENNFVSDLNPFVSENPETWNDLVLNADFPWLDDGVDPEIVGEEALAPPGNKAAWPPKTRLQSKYGGWDLGAFALEGQGNSSPPPSGVAPSFDPHDPDRDFPRLSLAPESESVDVGKPDKGFVLYPNDSEPTFEEMTFFWIADSLATSYEFWVEASTENGQQVLFDEVLSLEESHCANDEIICYYLPSTEFEKGAYIWWIRTQRGEILGDWSDGMTFNVGINERLCYVELVSPVETGSASPVFTWKANPGVDAYQLYIAEDYSEVEIFNQWYTSEEANCDESLCSVTPPVQLADGSYRWEMQAEDEGMLSPWSRSMVFTVLENPPSEIPELIHPVDTVFEPSLTFYWFDVPLTSGYTISVKDAQGNVIVERDFTREAANCNWQCSVALSETFEAGNYAWQVRANNAVGMGNWSEALYFQVELPPSDPPMIPTPQSPLDRTLSPGEVTFSWSTEDEVVEYHLWVNDLEGAIWVDVTLTPDDLGCSLSPVCSYTPSISFLPGDYLWFVIACNQAGCADWEEGVPFSISE